MTQTEEPKKMIGLLLVAKPCRSRWTEGCEWPVGVEFPDAARSVLLASLGLVRVFLFDFCLLIDWID
jgi:hypothetical protein